MQHNQTTIKIAQKMRSPYQAFAPLSFSPFSSPSHVSFRIAIRARIRNDDLRYTAMNLGHQDDFGYTTCNLLRMGLDTRGKKNVCAMVVTRTFSC